MLYLNSRLNISMDLCYKNLTLRYKKKQGFEPLGPLEGSVKTKLVCIEQADILDEFISTLDTVLYLNKRRPESLLE